MPDTKIEITDEMVDAALDTWTGETTWRDDRFHDGMRADMREALTAAFALVTPGAGFRAGAEMAVGIIERGQQTFGNSTRSLTPRVDGNMDGLAYADAIRAELAAMPDRITALYDAESSEVGDDISVSLAVKLVSAEDEIRTLKAALAALPEGGDGWRDISGAPKDGTEILTVGIDSQSVIATKWLSPGPYVRTPHTNYYKKDGWYWASWSEPVGPVRPTLWRPLPSPPAISPPLCDDAGGGT